MVDINDVLHKVTRPARYTGGEWNSIVKDWTTTDIKVALAYPDLYEIGMSNLGLSILYDLLNQQDNVLAERVYAPWSDMEVVMREAKFPLFSLESKRPLREFNIIGFSLGYELNYTNVLNMLNLAQIPVFASQRTDSDPLIIAGGGCVLNPEPMAEFIDLFVIGEGEEVLLELIEVVRDWKSAGKSELLRKAASIPGVYVPSLYQVDYHHDGTVASITPTVPEASPSIARRIVSKLPPPVTRPVVPYLEVVHDRAVVEIQRGCTRGCRFCQAGIIYRPQRERSQDEVLQAVEELLTNCGYDEVSLLSLSTTDYSNIENLVSALCQRYQERKVTLSLPSLRFDTFSVGLANSIRRPKKASLTFAPEAGSERLRQVINKSLSEKELLETAEMVFERGWTGLKLYFMIGLPTETIDDIQAIVDLVGKIRRIGGSSRRRRIKVSASTFIPKPHTPFQWMAQNTEEKLHPKFELLRLGLRKIGVHVSWQDPKTSLIEAVLARGDRRLGKVIHQAWQLGCSFDAWTERFDYEKWHSAFQECGFDAGFYAHRQRPLNELLPWSHIDSGVSPAFLRKEFLRAKTARETPDCRHGPCNACGLQRWEGDCRRRYDDTHR